MSFTPSRLQIDKEGFNRCPSRKEVRETIRKLGIEIDFADFERDFWKNEYDSMIFLIKPQHSQKDSLEQGLKVGQLAHQLDVDEFQIAEENDLIFVRFWWD